MSQTALRLVRTVGALLSLLAIAAAAPDTYLPWEGGASYYAKWPGGPPSDPNFFPVTVWLQDPSTARDYKAIGINLFVGLWKGPTEEQLKVLAESDMPVLAGFRESIRAAPNSNLIRGWTFMDEPDNAQPKAGGGWGPCVLPPVIVDRYRNLRSQDNTKPVYLNLGQGVVNEKWVGRGEVCGHHDEHYAEYIRGADIVSYDVYPVNSKLPLWYVGEGVKRLRKWANYEKPVWNWIETTAIRQGPKPTPAEIKAEVWMSIIQGSMGVGYFCHQFKPVEDPARPLHDPETREALAAINGQITSLARVLNERPVADGVTVSSSNPTTPVDTLLKRHGGETYLFAVGARPGGETEATFRLRGCRTTTVTVLGESRTILAVRGSFQDRFTDYQVHLYKIPFDPTSQ